jgi:hypothetical protein
MTVDLGFQLKLHFATLYLDISPILIFLVDEEMHLLQVIKFSCILL